MPATTTPPQWLGDFLTLQPEGDETSYLKAAYNHLAHHFEPVSGPEILKIQQMAHARLELHRLDQQTAVLQSLQREKAAEHYEITTQNYYDKLNRDLHKCPVGHFRALSEHALGITHLINRWQPIALNLQARTPIDLEHVLQGLLASGFSDNIRQAGEIGTQLVIFFLKLQKDPSLIVARWLVRSGIPSRETRELYQRVNHLVQTGHDAETARTLLLQTATRTLAHLEQCRKQLLPFHQEARKEFSQAHQTDRSISASLRVLEGFRRTQYTRLNKLEREFRTLQREHRKELQTALEHEARLEAIRNGTAQPRKSLRTSPPQKPDNPAGPPIPQSQSTSAAARDGKLKEQDLIQAVHQAAEFYENEDCNSPQNSIEMPEITTPRPQQPEPATNVKPENGYASWTNAQLANPSLRPKFRQTYQRASRNQRKTMLRLIAEEKARRCLPTALQPSG